MSFEMFASVAIRRPGVVGAVAPSSRRLAAVLASVTPTDGKPVVVELGPGTGSATRAISDRAPSDARHIAVEIDPQLAEFVGKAHDDVEVICGDAENLRQLLDEVGVDKVDAIVCGLPWSLFGQDKQDRLLEQITGALVPGGAFTSFAYAHTRPLPLARAFRRALEAVFDEVTVSKTVWANLPPAHVYVCRGPS